MLKVAGETGTGREKIELIAYSPGVQDTGDLEAATKTITATSEASGLGNADYSAALTLPKPDERLVIKMLNERLDVTIDSFDAATILYCRVYVDVQDAAHRLFDVSWNSTGAKSENENQSSDTIFDLLTDGAAHTLYFFFWVNQANNAVISVVQVREGIGRDGTAIAAPLYIYHTGFVAVAAECKRVGTGTPKHRLSLGSGANWRSIITDQTTPIKLGSSLVFSDGVEVRYVLQGTVATDLNYLEGILVVLRSEQ